MKIAHILKLSLLSKMLKNEATEERAFFVITLLTGIVAGAVAVFVHKLVSFLTKWMGTGEPMSWPSLGLGALAIFASGYITTRYFPSSSGSGIPNVRVALAVFHGNIPFRETIAKFVTSILTLISGMSLGREGPTVAICAGIGSYFSRITALPKKKVKALVAIGSAGGLAAAFNTPIAAVVFTLEEVVGDMNARYLGSIVISSVLASMTAAILTGTNQATFSVVYYEFKNPSELIIYLALGVLAAIAGPLWVKSVLSTRKYSKKIFRGHKLSVIMTTFLIIAALSHIHKGVLGSGHEVINESLLSIISDWKIFVLLFVLKFFATTISYGSGASGGLFMPTLFIGAMLGGVVGSLANAYFPGSTSSIGAYALVGMGAFFVSVIRTPFTSIIMIFEMTRDYKIILPLMIANVVSYAISLRIHKGSVYENISEQDGVHLPTREDNEILETLLVEDAMVLEPITLNGKLSVKEAMQKVRDTEISGYPVLLNGELIGLISTNDLGQSYAKNMGHALVKDICTKKIVNIYPDQSLLVGLHKLQQENISRLPVVSRINDKKLVGIITAEDIVNQFGFHIDEESKKGVIDHYEKQFALKNEKPST